MSAFAWQTSVSRRSAQKQRQGERESEARDAEALAARLGAYEPHEPPHFQALSKPCEEQLQVPEGCVGLLVGKKGANIKALQERLKVAVSIKEAEGGRLLTVSGSRGSVNAALRALDFASDTVDVPREMVGWLCGKGGRHLKLIKELSGIAVLRICQEGGNAAKDQEDGSADEGPDEHLTGRCWLELKGTRESVHNARSCLDIHMSYYPLFLEMREVEQRLDDQIDEARQKLGPRTGQTRRPQGAAAKGGGRGGQADRGGNPDLRDSPRSGSRGRANRQSGGRGAGSPRRSGSQPARGRGGGRNGGIRRPPVRTDVDS